MTRDDLIRSLADKQRHIAYKDMSVAVKNIIEAMVDALSQRVRIEVRGFGSFALRERAPGIARNPKTGEQVKTVARYAVHFKPGKDMKERVNNGYTDIS